MDKEQVQVEEQKVETKEQPQAQENQQTEQPQTDNAKEFNFINERIDNLNKDITEIKALLQSQQKPEKTDEKPEIEKIIY